MIPEFDEAFAEDASGRAGAPGGPVAGALNAAFFARYGGKSFADGLYRIVHPEDAGAWTARIAALFPDFAGRAEPFGFDWLGRAFALDSARQIGGEPSVLLFEPGTGEALEIPATLISFHDSELVDSADAAVAQSFHGEWMGNGGSAPRYDQCVGYKTPLFLGGQDALSNLEIIDIDVYWSVTADLLNGLRSKAPPPEKPRGLLGRFFKR